MTDTPTCSTPIAALRVDIDATITHLVDVTYQALHDTVGGDLQPSLRRHLHDLVVRRPFSEVGPSGIPPWCACQQSTAIPRRTTRPSRSST